MLPARPPARQEDEADSTDVNHHFIKAALPHLVPLLLEQLTKQVGSGFGGFWQWVLMRRLSLLRCAPTLCREQEAAAEAPRLHMLFMLLHSARCARCSHQGRSLRLF